MKESDSIGKWFVYALDSAKNIFCVAFAVLALTAILFLVLWGLGMDAQEWDFTAKYFAADRQEVEHPTLVHGQEASSYAMIQTLASSEECSEDPVVVDVRPDDHGSLSLLPKLGAGDYAKLQAFYSFKLLRSYGCERAKAGQRYWRMCGVEVKAGPAVLQPQVRDENGDLVIDHDVLLFLNWPGAELFPVVVDPPYAHNGIAAFTSNGSVGWGYGGESHIGPDGGPYMIWASSDPEDWTDRIVGSDALDDVGWFDEHVTPNPVFCIARKGGDVIPSGDGYRLVDFDEDGNPIGAIPFETGSPPVGAHILGLYLDDEELGWVEWQLDGE